MTIRKTIQWMFVIVLLAAAGGASFLYWFWTRSDELLRQQVEAAIAERAPHWRVKIDRARFDWVRKIHLEDVSIGTQSSPDPALRVQEIVITVDPDALTTSQNVILQRVQLFGPTIYLTRHADGAWSFKDLLPLPESQGLTPEWEIDHLQAAIHFEHPDGTSPTDIGLDDGKLQLVPSGKRQYRAKGDLQVDGLGKIQFDGDVDLAAGSWAFDTTIPGIPLTRDLIAVAEGISDQVRFQRIRLEEALNRLAPPNSEEPTALEQRGIADVATPPPSGTPLNASGLIGVNLQVKRWKPDGELDYRALVKLQQGNISHAALPFPLQDVQGTLYLDNRQFIARNVSARNAATQIRLRNAEWKRGDVHQPLRLEFDVRDLTVDSRLKEHVPAAWKKLFDLLQPAGQIDVEGVLVHDENGKWRPAGIELTAKNGSIAYEKFPYRISEITGTVTQQNDPVRNPGAPTELRLELLGRAGRRPVTARGVVTNPGPELQLALDIGVEQLAINDTFVDACPPGVQKAFRETRLRGTANVMCRLFRPAGPKQKIEWDVDGDVLDGSIEYLHFPYRLSNLTGKVAFRSREGIWHFNGAQGVHGSTRVVASNGEFGMPNSPTGTDLKLVLDVADLELDNDLEQALPPRILKVWKDVAPRGRADKAEVNVHWSPGAPPEINIPKVHIADGSLLLKAFPYGFEDLKGEARYGRHPTDPAKDLIEILDLSGRHDDTQVRTKGRIEFARQDGPTAEWRVTLENLRVDDLLPERPFRRALPEALRSMTDVLNPQGKVSLAGMIDFRGTLRGIDPITAGWDLSAILSQGTLTTGIDLKNVNGSVRAVGTWDGSQPAMRGIIALDSVDVWGHQLTEVRGPFELNGRELIVGSRKMFPENRQQTPPSDNIDPSEHIRAKGFGATFTLDAEAILNESTDYRVKVDMRDGNLRQYAQRYMNGTSNLSGTMDGWVEFVGRGSNPEGIRGTGQLQIRQADLYELPMMVQIFKALSFVPPTTNSAFKYALTTFKIANGQFDFDEIDMVGDAFSLRGRGAAKFDGRLALDFYSEAPKGKFKIPILTEVVFDPLTRGWMGVTVGGTVQAPRAELVAVPQLDAALKQFLGAFPRPGTAPPPLLLPWRAPQRTISVPQLRSQQERTTR